MEDKIITILRQQFPLLASPDLSKVIAEVGQIRNAKRGDILMDVGKYIRFMPLVTAGVIKIIRQEENGKEVLLYYLEGGKTCAMSMTCCMQQVKSNIRATVEEDAEIIMIPVQYVDEWMMKYSAWKNFIMQTYSSRFDQLLNTIDIFAFQKMDQRLLNYLQKKMVSTQLKFVASTNTEMAQELNTSREVVSRLLKKLELEGAITIDKGKVFLA